MRGGIIGDEEFLAWEPHSHMAFRFNEASTGSIAAFAEDYRIVPTADRLQLDVGDGDEAERRCRPHGHVARPTGDGANVPEVPVQPSRLYEEAVRHCLNCETVFQQGKFETGLLEYSFGGN